MTDLFKNPDPIPEPRLDQPQYAKDLFDFFGTVTTAPTLEPKSAVEQIVFYTDSLTTPTVYKLYFWSTNLRVWKSVSLT